MAPVLARTPSEDGKVVLVALTVEDVAERIDYGSRDESVALLGDGSVLLGSQCQHPLQRPRCRCRRASRRPRRTADRQLRGANLLDKMPNSCS